jgi:RHS repeat-associated protein
MLQETIWLGDMPVAVAKAGVGGGGISINYVWADHLNTPRVISNAANQVRWEWPNNDPFGNNPANEDPSGVGQFGFNLRFPGQYYDVETGNHYNYFRDFDPSIARYIESDPIGLVAGLNTYAYVGGNPLFAADRNGLRGGPGIPGWGGTAKPKKDPNSCECRLRAPDFVNFQLDYYVGSAWGTFSRSGNSFVGIGLNKTYPNPIGASGSTTVGWLNKCDVTPDDVDNFLGGYGGAGFGVYGGVGGGLMYSPGNGTATTVGIGAGANAGSSSSGSGGPGVGYSSGQGSTGLRW